MSGRTGFLRDAVHTMNVEEVLNYVTNLDGFDEYGRYGFEVCLHNVLLSESMRHKWGIWLDEEDVNKMWNEGYVPRVVVEYVCECYDLDYRYLAANVVTQMAW
jgi:hypothetical protein